MSRREAEGSLRHVARAVAGLNERIEAGRASVATLDELLAAEAGVRSPVDVVTVAFSSGFAGTAAMLCVPVAGRGVFTRAERIFLNGVPGLPGPAPNERLGVVDTLIVADRRSEDARRYDGAALLVDLLCGRSVKIECQSVEGSRHEREAKLAEIEFARLYVYSASVPTAPEGRPQFLEVLGSGSRIWVNGADGVLIGGGSRRREHAPAISLAADIHDMDASLFSDAGDAAPRHVIALAVPVLSASTMLALVAWGRNARPQKTLGPNARDAALRLATRIRAGDFLLTGSDMPL